jgi:hypothetical protein
MRLLAKCREFCTDPDTGAVSIRRALYGFLIGVMVFSGAVFWCCAFYSYCTRDHDNASPTDINDDSAPYGFPEIRRADTGRAIVATSFAKA